MPATIALLLARQARREAYASGGYLTGGVWLRRGERLAWTGLVLGVAAWSSRSSSGSSTSAGRRVGHDFAADVD